VNTTFTNQTLAEHRPLLYRFALLQLRDSQLADDAVQETLLAAWQSRSTYTGKAELRTWLIGILKHKLVDHWRRSARESALPETNELGDEIGEDDFFQKNGRWVSGPNTWSDPEAALTRQEFWHIYEACQNKLPPKMANVFMLRELVGLDANEVCQAVGMSEANYWVTMHRARLRLRECLDTRWFNAKKQEK